MKKPVQMNFKKVLLFMATVALMSGCSSDDDLAEPGTVQQPDVDVPVAVDDDITTAENTSVTIEDLLENDTVFEYARVSDFDAESEEGGSIADNRDGSFTYTPPENYIGEDSFSYTICDNANTPNCSSATVNVTITAASPFAEDDSYEIGEGRTLRISNYLDNDQLLDNATVTSVNSEETNATVVLEENGNISYTPAAGFSGEDSFTYTICDDDEEPTCATATITVNVIDEGSPVASDDVIVIGAGTGSFTIQNVLSNDDLTDDAEITSLNTTNSRGTVELNDDGSIAYTPEPGFVGDDTFIYSLCDDDTPNSTCVEATVTVKVVETISFNIPSHLQDYYNNVFFSTDVEANYIFLSDLTTSQHSTILSYGQRHDYLYDADASLEDPENVVLMYTGEERYWREYTSGNNSYSPQTFNTEHIYPQSRLTSEAAVTDLHHLRVADDAINSLRLNYPYADGSGEYELINESAWYPGDEWKGDVARMIMYLNVRYGETFEKVGGVDLFLEWNREDPVSAFEIQRNNVIEDAQGNRNPFIDNPYLATLIWGGEPAENTWD